MSIFVKLRNRIHSRIYLLADGDRYGRWTRVKNVPRGCVGQHPHHALEGISRRLGHPRNLLRALKPARRRGGHPKIDPAVQGSSSLDEDLVGYRGCQMKNERRRPGR